MIATKKIMVLTTTDNMIWQFLIPHIEHLKSLGNEVQCVCAKTGFWFDELKDKYGYTMHEIPFKRSPVNLANIKGYKKLKEIQKQEKFDLVYCQQPVGGLMGRFVGKKFKIPVIYTAHGFHFFNGCPFKNKVIFKTVEKWLSKYTDILVTINEEDYQAALKMKAKKVFKINGIGMDFAKYEHTTETKQEIRNSLNIKDDEFVIVTVAEFIKRKNYETMLKTVAELKSRGDKVRYLICGRGKDEELIKQQIKDLGIEDCVNLLGYRKDVNRIMMASDLFLIASYHEGLTLSVIEAMSFGLPCVVSDVRGNRDLIVEGKGGFTAETEDNVSFADKIEQILKDKELKQAMAEFNKEESKKYTIEHVKQQLEKIYKEIK